MTQNHGSFFVKLLKPVTVELELTASASCFDTITITSVISHHNTTNICVIRNRNSRVTEKCN
jgi:hypothetical protein